MFKTICIDARFWGIAHTGIGRYVENLIEHLPISSNIKIVLIVPFGLKEEPKLASFEKYYSHFHPYSLFSQIEMFILLLRIKPDLTHFTQFSLPIFWPGKFIVTIHDLIKHFSTGRSTTTRHPLIYWFKWIGYHIAMFVAVHRSTKIIVPAYYWKDIITRTYMLNPKKILVTYEGTTTQFLKSTPTQLRPEVPTPYVIYTGNLYPHKNVATLITAVDIINAENRLKKSLHLAIVCARSVFADRLPPSPWVKYLGRVSDAELASLYHHSAAFVFPSLIEGFGLPGLEAMGVGTPVIAAYATCLPEVYSDSALYFEPTNARDLANKIVLLLSDHKLHTELSIKGKLLVKKYSWEKMSKETWATYNSLL